MSPALLSRGVLRSSLSCTAPHDLYERWRDMRQVCRAAFKKNHRPGIPIVRISIIDAPEEDYTVRFEVGEHTRLALMTSSLTSACAMPSLATVRLYCLSPTIHVTTPQMCTTSECAWWKTPRILKPKPTGQDRDWPASFARLADGAIAITTKPYRCFPRANGTVALFPQHPGQRLLVSQSKGG
jgi:hypothetical protein